MISVRIVRDKEGCVNEFTIKGHAGAGASGNDIVCAAVSAIAYTAVGALKELAGVEGFKEKSGYMKCTIPEGISGEARLKARIILDAMAIGLKQVEYSYGEFVAVSDKEV